MPLLQLECADVQQCRAEPARLTMSCLSVGTRIFFDAVFIMLSRLRYLKLMPRSLHKVLATKCLDTSC